MRRVLAVLIAGTFASIASAQEGVDLRRFEIGAQTTMLRAYGGSDYFDGIGALWAISSAASLNLNRYFALDSAVSLFPRSPRYTDDIRGGRPLQMLVGLKTTLYRSRGITWFAKTRPGFLSWSSAMTRMQFINWPPYTPDDYRYSYGRRTFLAFDFGTGLEYKVAQNVALRVEVGDTVVRYTSMEFTGTPSGTVRNPAFAKHNVQTSTGIFYRFGGSLDARVPASSERSPILSRLEFGTQTTMLRTSDGQAVCPACSGPRWVIGPAFTFNLNDRLALDGLFGVSATAGVPGTDLGEQKLFGGHLMLAMAGVKATIRGSKFTLFTKLRPGVASWGKVLEGSGPTFVRRTGVGLDLGGGFEYAYLPPVSLRMEAGTTALHWLDRPGLSLNLQTSVGAYYRFGSRVNLELQPADAPSHRFFDRTNIAMLSASLLAQTSDAITTQRFFSDCRKAYAIWGSSQPDIERMCSLEEGNPLARPFAKHGWGGQIALGAIVNTGQTLVLYAVHRMGHHRVERVMPIPFIGASAWAAHGNLQRRYHWFAASNASPSVKTPSVFATPHAGAVPAPAARE